MDTPESRTGTILGPFGVTTYWYLGQGVFGAIKQNKCGFVGANDGQMSRKIGIPYFPIKPRISSFTSNYLKGTDELNECESDAGRACQFRATRGLLLRGIVAGLVIKLKLKIQIHPN